MAASGKPEGGVVFLLSKVASLMTEDLATRKARARGELAGGPHLERENILVRGPAKLAYIAAKVGLPTSLSAAEFEGKGYKPFVEAARKLEAVGIAAGVASLYSGSPEFGGLAAGAYGVGRGVALSTELVARAGGPAVREAGRRIGEVAGGVGRAARRARDIAGEVPGAMVAGARKAAEAYGTFRKQPAVSGMEDAYGRLKEATQKGFFMLRKRFGVFVRAKYDELKQRRSGGVSGGGASPGGGGGDET